MPEPMQLVMPPAGESSGRASAADAARQAPPPVLIRLDRIAATPGNIARIRELVRDLNRRLESAGTPLRLLLL